MTHTLTRADQHRPGGRRPVTVSVIDDYAVIVAGVARLLDAHRDRVQVVDLDLGERDFDRPVDVGLFDSFAQGEAHTDAITAILQEPKLSCVVMYTWNFAPELVHVGIERGLRGYLSKGLDADQLADAIERVAGGEIVIEDGGAPHRRDNTARRWPGFEAGLTERQAETLALIAAGLSNEEIAERLFLSADGLKSRIRATYRTIGVRTRAQAVAWALMNGFTGIVPDHARHG